MILIGQKIQASFNLGRVHGQIGLPIKTPRGRMCSTEKEGVGEGWRDVSHRSRIKFGTGHSKSILKKEKAGTQ